MYATVLSNNTPFSCFQKIVFFLCVAGIFRNMRSAQARHQSPKTNTAFSFQGRTHIFSKCALCYFSFFIGFDYHLLQTCMYFLKRDHTSGFMQCHYLRGRESRGKLIRVTYLRVAQIPSARSYGRLNVLLCT
jgi:hypothetical protein